MAAFQSLPSAIDNSPDILDFPGRFLPEEYTEEVPGPGIGKPPLRDTVYRIFLSEINTYGSVEFIAPAAQINIIGKIVCEFSANISIKKLCKTGIITKIQADIFQQVQELPPVFRELFRSNFNILYFIFHHPDDHIPCHFSFPVVPVDLPFNLIETGSEIPCSLQFCSEEK